MLDQLAQFYLNGPRLIVYLLNPAFHVFDIVASTRRLARNTIN
jgi:hypothetical protein